MTACLHPMVSSDVKSEWLPHMNQRVSAHGLARGLGCRRYASSFSLDPPTPMRKPGLGTTDSFDFSEIDKKNEPDRREMFRAGYCQ